MDLEKRIALISEVGEEIITEADLHTLLEKKAHPIAYDGFEPSGRVHIAQGLMRAINVNKMIKAGCKFNMLAADWHAWANNKLGGDLEKIQRSGDFLIEVWKASGMNIKKVNFVRSSDLLARKSYWKTVMRIARANSVKRLMRCSQIMGRKEGEKLSGSQIFYPCMQAADIFELKADITQLGMDQRKVNVLARETGPKLGFWKPVVVNHHMLLGLQRPKTNATGADRSVELKMSKSVPDSAIFMTDSEEEVERKINKAFCPGKEIKENPIVEYAEFLVFEKFKKMKIERPTKFGGNMELGSIKELHERYSSGQLHPMDLKGAVAGYVNKMLAPVRKHFSKGKPKKLLEDVKDFEVTR